MSLSPSTRYPFLRYGRISEPNGWDSSLPARWVEFVAAALLTQEAKGNRRKRSLSTECRLPPTSHANRDSTPTSTKQYDFYRFQKDEQVQADRKMLDII